MEQHGSRHRKSADEGTKKIHSSCIPLSLSPSSPFSSFFKVSDIFKCIITPSLLYFHLSPPSIFLFSPLTSDSSFISPPSSQWMVKSVVVHGIINCHCPAWKTHIHRRWEEHWGELFRVNRQILAATVCSVLYWDTCSTGKLNPFFSYLFHLHLNCSPWSSETKSWESMVS